jgi:AraC-like DNA-binding protein
MWEKSGRRIGFDSKFLDMPLIIGAGTDILRKPIKLTPHTHNGFELTFLADGEVIWETEANQQLRLVGGSGAIVQPGVKHRGRRDVITPGTLFWIVFNPKAEMAEKNSVFSPEALHELDFVFSSCGNIVVDCAPLADEFRKLRLLLESMNTDEISSTKISALRALLCLILAESREIFQLAAERKCSIMETAAEKYIKENISSRINVGDLATYFKLSISVFSERFLRECGMTPGDFIRRVKCRSAVKMLENPGKSVTGIAFDLGFSSSQYFASVFKKYHGVSPSQWRNCCPEQR